jgi:RNA polymerase sigma factor (sigma-70 family)
MFTDEDLVQHASRGSDVHFNALVDRYTHVVYRLAFGITRNGQEAEDIVQETFLKVFQNLDKFTESKGSFRTWILTIARNQSINVFSSLKRSVLRAFGDSEAEDYELYDKGNFGAPVKHDSEALLSSKQAYIMLQEALNKLPERQRSALLLKTVENMSYEEIASIMKTSVSSIESLIFRARRRLSEIIGDR